MPAVVHALPKDKVDAFDFVHSTCICRHNTAQLRLCPLIHALICIHIEYPVRIRLHQGKVPLPREIPREWMRGNTCAKALRQFRRTIRTHIVDHKNLIGKCRTPNARLDMMLLIVRENDNGKFHLSAPSSCCADASASRTQSARLPPT